MLIPLLVIAACAPGEVKAGLGPNETEVTAVTVVPDKPAIALGEATLIHATAQTAAGTTEAAQVDWSTSGGTIVAYTDSTALFTATSTGSYKIHGRGKRNTNLQDSTVIVVSQPVSPIVRVTVSPDPANLPTGGTIGFVVTGARQDGTSFVPSVTWTATGGTITSGGVYTAGPSAGTYRVSAVEPISTLADTSAVSLTVPAPVLQSVVLTPATASLVTGSTKQFSVAGQWSNGATTAPAVTYSATGGTINSSGLYTAGNTAGTFRVIAVQQGGTLADTSTVTLTTTAPVLQAVILTPASTSVVTGGTQQFTVSGQWSNGATTAPSVTYSATGGTISSGGLYTAGSTTGTFRVIAVQQGGTLADTAAVTLSVPSALYPNRPASYTNSTEMDFSQAPPQAPPANDQQDNAIPGAPGWNMIYFGTRWSQMSDPTAPAVRPRRLARALASGIVWRWGDWSGQRARHRKCVHCTPPRGSTTSTCPCGSISTSMRRSGIQSATNS